MEKKQGKSIGKLILIIVSLIKHQSSNLIIYKVNYLLSIIFFT